jgi:hypothetical protein
MNRFIKALARKLSRLREPVAEDKPSKPVSMSDAVMPDIYANRNDGTKLNLIMPNQPLTNFDESDGFNPYDTAVLHKKQ